MERGFYTRLAPELSEGGGVEFGSGGGEDGFRWIRGVAGPVGDGAAGAADDGDEGGDIPGVHDGIEGDVDEAGGEQEVAVAVGPRAVESAGVDEAVACVNVLVAGEVAVIAGDECGGGEVGRGTGADELAVQGRGRVVADDELTEGGLVDGPEDGVAVVQEADESGPERHAGDEALGAVDGIEHPDPFGLGVQSTVFFSDDAVVGESSRDHVAHDFFRATIGCGHGGIVRLEVNGGAGIAKVGRNKVGAGLSEFGDEETVGGEIHGRELAISAAVRHGHFDAVPPTSPILGRYS